LEVLLDRYLDPLIYLYLYIYEMISKICLVVCMKLFDFEIKSAILLDGNIQAF